MGFRSPSTGRLIAGAVGTVALAVGLLMGAMQFGNVTGREGSEERSVAADHARAVSTPSTGDTADAPEQRVSEVSAESAMDGHAWGPNTIGPITDVVNEVDVLVEVAVTDVTSPTYNTADGTFPSSVDTNDMSSFAQQMASREITVMVSDAITATDAYFGLTGVVFAEDTSIMGGQVQASSFLPVGTTGMLGLVTIPDDVLADPEPFVERVVHIADSLSVGGQSYYPLSKFHWFIYHGDTVRHEVSGEVWNRAEFRNLVSGAVQP